MMVQTSLIWSHRLLLQTNVHEERIKHKSNYKKTGRVFYSLHRVSLPFAQTFTRAFSPYISNISEVNCVVNLCIAAPARSMKAREKNVVCCWVASSELNLVNPVSLFFTINAFCSFTLIKFKTEE